MGMTIAQRILASRVGREVKVGEIVEVDVDLAMSHDNAALVIRQFEQIGIDRVWDPTRIVIILDHRAPSESIKTSVGHKKIREFVQRQGINNFFDIGYGICHQVMIEEGFSAPGKVIVGTDSHTTSHGAVGSFATGIGATEMAGVWATGRIWFRVPPTIRIDITGRFPYRVVAKDLILKIIGMMGADGAQYKAVEFHGPLSDSLPLNERIVLSNLSMEMGAKVAIFKTEKVVPDQDAEYEQRVAVDVSDLPPQIACPHQVDNVRPVAELSGTKIDQVVIGSCTNGRIEDLREAWEVLKEGRVAKGVRLIVVPASRRIYLQALSEGIIEGMVERGAVVINPGCGPCLGAHQGLLAPGERCLATTNRNFKGRMGSPEAEIYLGSPYTAAATALTGRITDPSQL
ncbi:3-isopropylmalate dehydratase large subunit [candidate division WOR-3 bacterium]|uniref:3-isopropylmalate dehydratase large subunit n=1 Tax=candidate division WOR-3 bacterium TaxID=2052148 RepID=A0A660SHS1_UNCW3|nr:MAG: 3-isopropylmalate dehydratase large subunit [candidate division WOR-3 bacterium]